MKNIILQRTGCYKAPLSTRLGVYIAKRVKATGLCSEYSDHILETLRKRTEHVSEHSKTCPGLSQNLISLCMFVSLLHFFIVLTSIIYPFIIFIFTARINILILKEREKCFSYRCRPNIQFHEGSVCVHKPTYILLKQINGLNNSINILWCLV
jgi:hypothetical protein